VASRHLKVSLVVLKTKELGLDGTQISDANTTHPENPQNPVETSVIDA